MPSLRAIPDGQRADSPPAQAATLPDRRWEYPSVSGQESWLLKGHQARHHPRELQSQCAARDPRTAKHQQPPRDLPCARMMGTPAENGVNTPAAGGNARQLGSLELEIPEDLPQASQMVAPPTTGYTASFYPDIPPPPPPPPAASRAVSRHVLFRCEAVQCLILRPGLQSKHRGKAIRESDVLPLLMRLPIFRVWISSRTLARRRRMTNLRACLARKRNLARFVLKMSLLRHTHLILNLHQESVDAVRAKLGALRKISNICILNKKQPYSRSCSETPGALWSSST